ncbi:hypothetical protein [Rufibacter quisquiliarum]|uniref:Uncharacterized protein n=1 Tax=Rufibacter quisquiliarum TaxID=1549639 RepID=A0A839GQI4_9BACT|nr:hypothetical protein [Rufibacter quisquiliarum]MBA9076091.1 hypothetical protein [Rufibacter quisquiliarum]
MQLNLFAQQPPPLHLKLSRTARKRRDFTTADRRFIMANYTHGWMRAKEVAQKLERTYDSVRVFIERNPELQKHPRPAKQAA